MPSSIVNIDEDSDLDDEDRAILAEIAKKGYYHGRPKNQAGPPPAKIEAAPPQSCASSNRADFDDFQKKWDRFDDDTYLKTVERDTLKASSKAPATASAATPKKLSIAPQPKLAFVAEFKILLVGDGGVGKSMFLKSHLTGEFDNAWTRGVEEQVHQLRFHTNCGDIALNVWECCTRNSSQRERFYMSGHGAIVMFDVTKRSSFRSVPTWQKQIKTFLGTVPTVLLGNKVDAAVRQVTPQQIQSHARQRIQYYDVSVRDKYNFELPFLWLVRRLTNQPRLQFVGPFARHPCQPSRGFPTDSAVRGEHAKQLRQAMQAMVRDDSSA